MASEWVATVREMAKQSNVPAMQVAPRKRETRQRRAAATRNKWLSAATSDVDVATLRAAARIDMMLDADTSEPTPVDEDDEAYEAHRDDDAGGQQSSGRTKRQRGASGGASKTGDAPGSRPKPPRPMRTVAQMLLDDFGDGTQNGLDYVSMAAPYVERPRNKICYVTGRKANYTDPQTGLDYADAEALAVLRENPPAWVKLTAPSSPYFEAMQQIRAERARRIAEAPDGKPPTGGRPPTSRLGLFPPPPPGFKVPWRTRDDDEDADQHKEDHDDTADNKAPDS